MAPAAALLSALSLLALHASAESLYPKSSQVLQLDGKSYEKLIAKSNYTSIIEFYAPWCGHCKNLKPAYEKAAASLAGVAKVAAINCDDDANKPFCGSMGVQGFPTLKIVKPAKKKGGRPVVEDYQGQRTAKAISDAVSEKIPNHVTRVKDDNFEKFVSKDADTKPKALVFSEKGLVSSLVKALAIDFLGALDVGYARNADKKVVDKYGVTSFPSVLLFPTGGGEPIKYDGEMKKAALIDFFSQAATPNPDAKGEAASGPSSSGKAAKGKKSEKKAEKKDKKKAKAEEAAEGGCPYAAAGGPNPHTAPTSETVETETVPVESPDPRVDTDSPKPVQVKVAPKITSLDTEEGLQTACLNSKSTTCILSILPKDAKEDDDVEQPQPVITSLSEIHYKHAQRGAKIFPFYSVPGANAAAAELVKELKLSSDKVQVIAVNAKKGWWRHYEKADFSQKALEAWVDDIRFGDFSKSKLPKELAKEIKSTEPPKETVVKVGEEGAEGLKVEWVEPIEHGEL